MFNDAEVLISSDLATTITQLNDCSDDEAEDDSTGTSILGEHDYFIRPTLPITEMDEVEQNEVENFVGELLRLCQYDECHLKELKKRASVVQKK